MRAIGFFFKLIPLSVFIFSMGCGERNPHKHTHGIEHLDEKEGLYISAKGSPLKHPDTKIFYRFDEELQQDIVKGCLNSMDTLKEVTPLEFIEVGSLSDATLTFVLGRLNQNLNHQGTTKITAIDEAIIEAEVTFDMDINYSLQPTKSDVDVESVCLHEISHAVGLAHSDSKDSVMYYGLIRGDKKRAFSDTDKRNLARLYGEQKTTSK